VQVLCAVTRCAHDEEVKKVMGKDAVESDKNGASGELIRCVVRSQQASKVRKQEEVSQETLLEARV